LEEKDWNKKSGGGNGGNCGAAHDIIIENILMKCKLKNEKPPENKKPC